jgi:hypothetical protein
VCEPATIIAGASLAIEVGSSIAGASAQNKASKANKAAAEQAMRDTWKDISLREVQEQDSTSLTIMQADRQARSADAVARVSAGEAGVAGASVDALIGDISRQASDFKVTAERNLDATITQLQREKVGAKSAAQSRINAVPSANPFATSLQIVSAGVNFADKIVSRKPSKG